MYFSCDSEDLRSYCRTSIETMELWARHLIHNQMVTQYGVDYLNSCENGEYLLNRGIREHALRLKEAEPQRFPRPVDTLNLEHIIQILCHPAFYRTLFKVALDYNYPQGKEEAREFFQRVVPIRNALSHSNPITVRQAEQAVCYTHDFVEAIKQYYKDTGKERMWNIPTIISLTDSCGNVFTSMDNNLGQIFYVGETYKISAEIDSSFPRETYSIEWMRETGYLFNESSDSSDFVITFSEEDVGEAQCVRCLVISKENWHKHRYCDDEKRVIFSVLPKIT